MTAPRCCSSGAPRPTSEANGADLYLGKSTMDRIDVWRVAAGVHHGPLFRRLTGRGTPTPHRLSPRSVRRAVARAAESVGIEGASGHSLRVGAAVSLVRSGAQTLEVQQVGRCKDQRMPATKPPLGTPWLGTATGHDRSVILGTNSPHLTSRPGLSRRHWEAPGGNPFAESRRCVLPLVDSIRGSHTGTIRQPPIPATDLPSQLPSTTIPKAARWPCRPAIYSCACPASEAATSPETCTSKAERRRRIRPRRHASSTRCQDPPASAKQSLGLRLTR